MDENIITVTDVKEIEAVSLNNEDILGLGWSGIGEYVLCNKEGRFAEIAKKASTICRRRFKPEDVVVISVLDEDQDGEAGTAFTKKGIFHWDDDAEFDFGVLYSDIVDVDYDDDSVKLIMSQSKEVEKIEDNEEYHGVSLVKEFGKITAMLDPDYILNGFKEGYKEKKDDCRYLPCVCDDSDMDEEEILDYVREMYNFIADILEIICNKK